MGAADSGTKSSNDPSSALRYEKILSNIREVTARYGRVIAIATEGDDHISQLVEHTVCIPQSHELLLPILEVVPLQLLAYHIASCRGCKIDQGEVLMLGFLNEESYAKTLKSGFVTFGRAPAISYG